MQVLRRVYFTADLMLCRHVLTAKNLQEVSAILEDDGRGAAVGFTSVSNIMLQSYLILNIRCDWDFSCVFPPCTILTFSESMCILQAFTYTAFPISSIAFVVTVIQNTSSMVFRKHKLRITVTPNFE